MGNVTWDGTALSAVPDEDLVADFDAELVRQDKYRLRELTARRWVAIMRTLDQQGVPMTVRGLFYSLEMSGLAPKSEKGYDSIQRQVLAMRRCGVLPYSFIADNTRYVRRPRTYSGLDAYFRRSSEAYRRALWDNQGVHVEIWCEKDAISGMLEQVTQPWDVELYVVRGYSSETLLHGAAESLKEQGKPAYIYYFGDLDPSGWDISEKIVKKLREFGADFTFERLAVYPELVAEWRLPTRPAKRTDSRGKNWKWPCVEIDAVPANRLRELCEGAITRHIDEAAVEATRRAEQLERESLEQISRWWTTGHASAGNAAVIRPSGANKSLAR